METLEVDIIRILTNTRDAIRANMDAEGVNASGRTSASIYVREYEGGFQLVVGHDGTHNVADTPSGSIWTFDTAPAPTLEKGRKGGKVPRGFYHILKQWSREKGIMFENERARSTFAYFLAQKIAENGTKRNAANVDVYTTACEDAKKQITQAMQAYISNTMRAAVGRMGVHS